MSNYHTIPVKEEHLPAVMKFIAELEEGGPAVTRHSDTRDPRRDRNRSADWSIPDLERFYRGVQPDCRRRWSSYSNPETTASAPRTSGEPSNTSKGAYAIAGMLGAAGRRCLNRYAKSTMPWTSTYEESGNGEGRTMVRVPAEYRAGISKAVEASGA